ncbi:glucosaminidase domain-containing protein [Fructilactobacillus vespulae]|uniref:glucosaminidase domain-containing protein n=1 Tax=Fructilactobacillus vespulae TaxID=1249630 RepID=UPI0039B69B20
MDKINAKRNQVSFETGEQKLHSKLAKSKHGWVKVTFGVTFASLFFFGYQASVSADEATAQPTITTAQVAKATDTTTEAKAADKTTTDSDAAKTTDTKATDSKTADQTATKTTDEAKPATTTDTKSAAPKTVDTKMADAEQVKAPAVEDKTVQSAQAQAAVVAPQKAAEPAVDTDTYTAPQTASAETISPRAASEEATYSSDTDGMTQTSGSYTAQWEQNVRNQPSINGQVTGQLQAGDTINYNGSKDNDGYTWLHYQNFAGQDRWIAKLANQTANTGSTTSSNQQFIDSIAPGAIETWKQYGVLPSVSIAQAIVESAWGSAAPGNNLFGIKGNYNGQSTTLQTQEWNGSGYVTIYDQFRAYPSYAESVADHGRFLFENSRYNNLLGDKNYTSVAWKLQNDGYATSPTYANTLISIIQYNGLNKYDAITGEAGAFSQQPTVSQPTNNQSGSNQTTGVQTPNFDKTYIVRETQNVRTDASINAAITGQLHAGDVIGYDNQKNADGYTWLHYQNFVGQDRWIADLTGVTNVDANNNDSVNTPATNNGTNTTTAANNNQSNSAAEVTVPATGNQPAGFRYSTNPEIAKLQVAAIESVEKGQLPTYYAKKEVAQAPVAQPQQPAAPVQKATEPAKAEQPAAPAAKQAVLPQTGETNNGFLAMVGASLVSLFAFIGLGKMNKKNN